MIITSTIPNDKTIINIVARYLRNKPSGVQKSKTLIKMIPVGEIPQDLSLKMIHLFLKMGQDRQAKNILKNIDMRQNSENFKNINQTIYFFNMLIHTGLCVEAVQSLENEVIAEIFCENDIIDLRCNIGRSLIFKGQPQLARKVLSKVNEAILLKKDTFSLLGDLYFFLSMFDKANHMFDIATGKKSSLDNISTYMAFLYLAAGKINKATTYVDKHMQHNIKNPVNLLYKAKLFNYLGNHVNALDYINILLSKTENAVYRCIGFIEKGDTLRLQSKYKEANNYYQKAQKTDIEGAFWLWIAYFEHAMTLVYIDNFKEALKIAWKGCECKSYKYSSKYNPCIILYHFLLFWLNRSDKFFITVEKWAGNILLWPFHAKPHKIWMLLLTVIVLKEQVDNQSANKIIHEIINNLIMIDKKRHDFYVNLLSPNNFSFEKNFLNALSNTVWRNDFNWRVIRKLACARISIN